MKLHSATLNGIDAGAFAVFEGRLANRQALENELHACGKDDAALIHEAFLAWGEDFPSHLEGEFACAVFDMDGEQLLLVGDRLGTIPLYLTCTPNAVVFASRLDDFLKSRAVPPVADFQAVWNYLTLGAVPLPGTILKGVQGLRPGEMARVALRKGDVTRHTWWSLPACIPDEFARSPEGVRQVLSDAVAARAPAFENGRLLLSGGLDSCILLALASEWRPGVPTLTIGYETRHNHWDETALARKAASYFGANAKYITVTDWDVSKEFSNFILSMDSPSRDGLNMYFASKAAKASGADAVITGLAGDEFFGGYAYVQRHLRAERLSRVARWLGPLAKCLPDRLRHSVLLPTLTPAERLETIRAQAYDGAKRQFLNPSLLEGHTPISWREQCAPWADETLDTVRRLTRFDICLDMAHTLLRDSYAHAGARGIAAIAPLACREVADMAWRLPSSCKVRDGIGKAILRDAFGAALPSDILQAPKRGFEMPLLAWLGGTLLPRARDAFQSKAAQMLFNGTACRNWSERLGMLQSRDYPLWSRFILVEWLRARGIQSIQ